MADWAARAWADVGRSHAGATSQHDDQQVTVARYTRGDVEQFYADRSIGGADLSGVSGAPTPFFIDGRRQYGAYDIATLSNAVRAAGAQARASDHGASRRARPEL